MVKTPKLCGTQLHPEMVWNNCVVPTTLNPAISAPPGLLIPNVTAAANHKRPVSEVAVRFVKEL